MIWKWPNGELKYSIPRKIFSNPSRNGTSKECWGRLNILAILFFLCIICTSVTCIFDNNWIFSFDQHNMESYLAPAGNDIEVPGSAKDWLVCCYSFFDMGHNFAWFQYIFCSGWGDIHGDRETQDSCQAFRWLGPKSNPSFLREEKQQLNKALQHTLREAPKKTLFRKSSLTDDPRPLLLDIFRKLVVIFFVSGI